MAKEAIFPPDAPKPKGPYSPAVAFDNLIFVSGQIPADPETGEIKNGTVEEEARLTFDNVKKIVEAAGSSMANVLKGHLYVSDMENFSAVNEVYKESFGPNFPARTCIQAGRLPFDVQVECDVIAYRERG